MRVAVPKETMGAETRVALTPGSAKRLAGEDVQIAIQGGAGLAAGFPDDAYREVGVEVVSDLGQLLGSADLVLKVNGPGVGDSDPDEAGKIKNGATVIAIMKPHQSGEALARMAERGLNGLSMELMPRITRAQRMDALSSMSTVAGYKAVLMAADSLGKFFPMLMTAAGTVSPAKVLVLGAGVAGLQAIATAKRLGAVVEAFDIREAAKEEIKSLGATPVEWEAQEGVQTEGEGGYAAELSKDTQALQREALTRHVADSDAVISTALVPGRAAPLLVTTAMVEGMAPGSVIVDLAAETGGNCELTKAGKTIEHNGVIIHGPVDLAARVPFNASQMYARNVVTLVKHLTGDEGLTLDMDDEITGAICVTYDGKVRFEA
jgi:NAD(P) transhydrogenase subunit alpha